jgi:hypothetical protein
MAQSAAGGGRRTADGAGVNEEKTLFPPNFKNKTTSAAERTTSLS